MSSQPHLGQASASRDAVHTRPASDADAEAAARVMTAANPEQPPVTAETVRWVWDRRERNRPHLWMVAEADGRVVGNVMLRGVPIISPLYLLLDVDPAYQRRGIGSELLGEALAATGNETEISAQASAATPQGTQFLQARGFVEFARQYESVLDLAGFDVGPYEEWASRIAEGGYRLSSLADEDSPQLRRQLHRLTNDTFGEALQGVAVKPTTLDEWTRDFIKAPHARPSAFAIAFQGSAPVALSCVTSQTEGVGYMFYTAVAREHRGRGIGLATKVHALRAGQTLGLREVWTDNDPANGPMLAINRRLGFKDRPALVHLRKNLADPGFLTDPRARQ